MRLEHLVERVPTRTTGLRALRALWSTTEICDQRTRRSCDSLAVTRSTNSSGSPSLGGSELKRPYRR